MGLEYKANEVVGKVKYCSFFILCTLSLAASIMRYSSTSSTEVSSFLSDVLVGLSFSASL